MKILVVDDNRRFLDKMQKNLTLDKHVVVTVLSGAEALEELMKNSFDLVLTDLQMNGLSGIEFIKEMRKNRINTVTIVITGYGSIESAVEAMKAGAYDYLLKPFEITVLREKISEVEKELQLKQKIKDSFWVTEQLEFHQLTQSNLNEYEGPFLVISTGNPADIARDYGLSDVTAVSIDYTENRAGISPSKLHLLLNRCEEFVKKQEKGTIIFKGMKEMLKAHAWDDFKQFIMYLQKKVFSSGYSLLFLLEESGSDENNYHEQLLHDALAHLSAQSFTNMVNTVSHPLRKSIITTVKIHGTLNFKTIAEELNVEKSSVLAFHVNKLVKEEILAKNDHTYSLTPRGQYFDEIIYILEKLGLSDPGSRVRAFRIPGKSSKHK
ncbi:MAG: response regulator [Candidatus Odinarchaeota archaeon]